MKLNPITALSGFLEKLVIEHGSAVITEKNLAFLRDQLAVMEKEIAKLTVRLEKSEAKNQTLKTENKNLKRENADLKTKIQRNEKPIHSDLLDPEQIKILRCLATLRHGYMLPFKTIMSTCNISEQAALYYLQELEDKSMIESDDINDDPHWCLDHDGRSYLIKHKLVS